MRKSLLAATLGAVAISIAALAAPALAHDTNVTTPRAQVYEVPVAMTSTQPLPSLLASADNTLYRLPITDHYHPPQQATANARIAKTMQKNGTKVREFTKNASKDWNNHQLRQRHPHIMQG